MIINRLKAWLGKKTVKDEVKPEPENIDKTPDYAFDDLKDKIVASLKEISGLPKDKKWLLVDGFVSYLVCDKFKTPFWSAEKSVPCVLLGCKETGEIKLFALKKLLPDLDI